MSSAKNKAINKARKLIGLLKTNGIDVCEAYLLALVQLNR